MSTIKHILEKDEYKNKPFIIGGDFNMVRDIHLDYSGSNVNKKQSKLSYEFEKFLVDYNAVDMWRLRNATRKQLVVGLYVLSIKPLYAE